MGIVTWFWRDLPWWALAPLGAWIIAWQMNLQHEVIHGHPTPWRTVNEALGVWPLSLWLPYRIYRETHMRHHQDANLTDPFEDPESYYWTTAGWRDLGPARSGAGRTRNRRCSAAWSSVRPGWSGASSLNFARDAWRGRNDARSTPLLALPCNARRCSSG